MIFLFQIDSVLSSKDARMGLLNEVLNSVKIIKYYAWEIKFMDKVNAAREAELKNLLVHIHTYIHTYRSFSNACIITELLPVARLLKHLVGGGTRSYLGGGLHHTYIYLRRTTHSSYGILLPDDIQPPTVSTAAVS